MSEGEKALKTQIDTLESTIAGMNAAKVKADLETKFPALKDKAAEFAEFRKAYPAGNDESIAKIFPAGVSKSRVEVDEQSSHKA